MSLRALDREKSLFGLVNQMRLVSLVNIWSRIHKYEDEKILVPCQSPRRTGKSGKKVKNWTRTCSFLCAFHTP